MDVWFDSGSSWAGVLGGDEALNYPADLYLEVGPVAAWCPFGFVLHRTMLRRVQKGPPGPRLPASPPRPPGPVLCCLLLAAKPWAAAHRDLLPSVQRGPRAAVPGCASCQSAGRHRATRPVLGNRIWLTPHACPTMVPPAAGLRPAPRLVPVLPADQRGGQRARALQAGPHARFCAGR